MNTSQVRNEIGDGRDWQGLPARTAQVQVDEILGHIRGRRPVELLGARRGDLRRAGEVLGYYSVLP